MSKTTASGVPDARYSGHLFWTDGTAMPADVFTLAYARVSAPEQNPEKQLQYVEAAGCQPDATRALV
jgi:hypothetical protein